MIALLREQHEDLQAITHRLEAIVRESSPDRPRLAQLRHEMSALLLKHLSLEEQLVYAPLRALPEAEAEMRRNDADLRERRLTYSAHISAWPPERITDEWSHYRRDVLALTHGLQTRIAYEDAVIYPLFDRLHPQARHA